MNRLATQTSPYLLQHANNPVDWYPWGPEALAKAQAEDKPVFLSIGYAACHWCHVMAHESFENPAIAALMNQHFINIKVDREERPDLDSIYMDAVVALTGHGGWPMSVFLTPSGQPFYGGTYYPPTRRGGMPAFTDILNGIHDAWLNRRDTVLDGGQEVINHIQGAETGGLTGADDLKPSTLAEAAKAVFSQFDWRHAGWGQAPKFPQPMTVEFLLRHHLSTGDPLALEMVTKTLDAMLKGGMYDQLGGGFHRYSTDAVWLVPHFEKMLYDNSQLARAYLHAWQVTHNPEYKRCVEEILDYVLREMTDPTGGFYSTQDADSEGEEGKFFIWDESEIDDLLGKDAELFKGCYGISSGGNFEGRNILFVANSLEAVAGRYKLNVSEVGESLARSKSILFREREKRVHPGLDDKVLSGWNGLMLAAFAEAARILDRSDYLAAAQANARFLLQQMRTPQGRLYRTWRKGEAKLNGYAEDYAAVCEGLLTLYESDFDVAWFAAAQELADTLLTHFADPAGGFFDTSDDHEALVFRPKSLQDNAVPSGNSLAVTALLKLGSLTGEGRYTDAAEKILRQVQPALAKYPTGFGQWLVALSYALSGPREIAIVGDVSATATRVLLSEIWSAFRPFQVTAVGTAATPIPLLFDRRQLNGQTTVYVCEHFACRTPVTDLADFRAILNADSAVN